ncbi:hypothetical protein DYI95_003245 [Thermaerobacter sp. PB12/4term]|uniref:hypothetical protein n=1 Tax=Thermaerobacter sp. PB12/4term TaxID=2293838 RepID=UPI000E327155|nr:hypothetical protein [Thermaerobacter sp. PB12/4term]QIA26671.1 hypothetical protein DYI95_003245 [Thermaerobacter sp. PB12/4term]
MTRIEVTGAVNALWLVGFLLVRYLAEAGPAAVGAPGVSDTAKLFGWAVPMGLVLFGVAWGGYAIGRVAAQSERQN